LTDDALDQIRADAGHSETAIDNSATYTQIRYLAKVHTAQPADRYADAVRRGVDYLLNSQYDNGGFPMIFPLQHNYTAHITFNDTAMIGVMRLLRDIAERRPPFDFLDEFYRQMAIDSTKKGLDAILKCQIVVEGNVTAWCAQHDQLDFKPRAARTYELPSISGSESVGVVEYLMDIEPPTPEVRRAVEGAVAWFDAVKIEGLRVKWIRQPELRPPFDVVVEEDPEAKPLWARFYEIGTNRPMFVGRDGVVHDRLADIEHERRTNYSYLGPYARVLLEKKYPAWKKKWGGD
jgi:PelA/Pel-15E family pectate lyase